MPGIDRQIEMEILRLAREAMDVDEHTDEHIPVVDESGKVLGFASRALCHRLGLRHAVVYLMVTDAQGRVLLQRRGTREKKRYDVAVGGHIVAGDSSPLDALLREMEEELGFGPRLGSVGEICRYNRVTPINVEKPLVLNREYRYLYTYELSDSELSDLEVMFDGRTEQEAVTGLEWMAIRDLLELSDANLVADGLRGSLPWYIEWKLKRLQHS